MEPLIEDNIRLEGLILPILGNPYRTAAEQSKLEFYQSRAAANGEILLQIALTNRPAGNCLDHPYVGWGCKWEVNIFKSL